MHEDAAGVQIGAWTAYGYGAFVALGALAMVLTLAVLQRKRRLPDGTALVFGVVCAPLALITARLLFCLLDPRFLGVITLRAALSFWGGGLSMAGALLGAAAAAWITSRILRFRPAPLFDAAAVALMLFVAFARLGEGFTETLGRSRPLAGVAAENGWIIQSDGYDAYLRTYILEAAAALVVAVALLIRMPRQTRPGDTALTGMLLFGCAQALLESLRFDAHMRISFVSLQQIFYAMTFAAALLVFTARYAAVKNSRAAIPIAVGLLALVVGGAIGLEFMIDRSDVSDALLYAAYAALMASPAVMGLMLKRRACA